MKKLRIALVDHVYDAFDDIDSGIITIWVFHEKSYNEELISKVPIWDILNAKELYDLCINNNALDIEENRLNNFFEKKSK